MMMVERKISSIFLPTTKLASTHSGKENAARKNEGRLERKENHPQNTCVCDTHISQAIELS